jgi:pimeloyl-ACP methyl ester carboxylesterase
MNTDEIRTPLTLFAAACLWSIAVSATAATAIPPGKWSFVFTDARGRADRPMRVYTYKPRKCDEKCPLVFVLHGETRDASAYRDLWEIPADRFGLVVVAPEFAERHWAGAAGYNLGDVERQDDREKWAFSAIEHLFDEVREGRTGYRIFGHSAGAQFIQRMMLFRPDHRAAVAVAANPGWYTMPEWRKDRKPEPFPYSLLESRAGERELRQALERRFVLMVGEKDTDPDDRNLNRTPGALKQGAHRLERAETFFKAATAAAAELGVKLAWELMEVPNTAHDAAAMSRQAAEIVSAPR